MAREKEFSYEIVEHMVDLSENKGGWIKQMNKVRWGSSAPVVDLRTWHYPKGSSEPDRMGKGITLSKAEMQKLLEYLKGYNFDTIDLPF